MCIRPPPPFVALCGFASSIQESADCFLDTRPVPTADIAFQGCVIRPDADLHPPYTHLEIASLHRLPRFGSESLSISAPRTSTLAVLSCPHPIPAAYSIPQTPVVMDHAYRRSRFFCKTPISTWYVLNRQATLISKHGYVHGGQVAGPDSRMIPSKVDLTTIPRSFHCEILHTFTPRH